MFKKGDRVTIKPEWRNHSNINLVYEISEWNIDRGFIFPVKWLEMGLSFAPKELVREQMIEKINQP